MSAESCRLTVKLKPQAKRESVFADPDGTILVSVSAPPIDGKANKRAIAIFTKALHLPKSACTIIKGHTSKNKIFEITGLSRASVLNKLAENQSN
jgi:uncharacterized protein (TIGR00251 family)